ncbi:hypothetical protein GNF10_31080 [Nostoc sp. UCD121]|uniref:hypothetical protein n=1 Tax=unclassified Nostoc TaxID=2593658 RepID=UPI00162329E9|nr:MULTISPECIES: hypothetical protein [unclassified Nostoc]MBC1225209.1 hypothetical protein [Nostoc sp. UCD120]MBC1280273.1 hypothetical protein [Nostoc sp. UCD121]
MPVAHDDSWLQPLGEAFHEVAFRANRLREWMEFEPLLRNLENRFSQFYSEVKNTSKDNFGSKVDTIQTIWSFCQESDIVDLEKFTDGIQHINQSLVTGDINKSDPTAQVLKLIDIGGKIRKSMDDLVFNDLKTNSNDFQMLLKGLTSNRRNVVGKEVRELCELTIRLRAEFKF